MLEIPRQARNDNSLYYLLRVQCISMPYGYILRRNYKRRVLQENRFVVRP
jgi:hypothetical protein